MREGWEEVTLGEVAYLDTAVVDVEPTGRYPIVGVLNRGRGLLQREPISGKQTKYKTLNRMRQGQIVYSRLKAFEGAITVIPEGMSDTFASAEFPTFTCGPRLSPEFFKLETTLPALWTELQRLSTGMGGRRERVKPADFLTIRILLPPVVEQRRIVNLIGAADEAIDASLKFLFQAERCGRTVARTLMIGREFEQSHLGDVADWYSGNTPKAGEPRYYDGGTVPWAVIADVQNRPISSTAATITNEAVRYIGRLAPVGSILVTMYGSIGRAALVRREMATNQAIAWGIPHPHVRSDYLFQWIKLHQRELDSLGRGATQRNINRQIIREFPISVPPLAEQDHIVELLASFDTSIDAASADVRRLRELRSQLLTALLSGEREIPGTYDDFLEVAA